jgi:hypothetical protein
MLILATLLHYHKENDHIHSKILFLTILCSFSQMQSSDSFTNAYLYQFHFIRINEMIIFILKVILQQSHFIFTKWMIEFTRECLFLVISRSSSHNEWSDSF